MSLESAVPTKRSLRRARLLQFAGIIIAILGLIGYWLSRDVERATWTPEALEIIGAEKDDKPISFVVAGRDRKYTQLAGAEKYDENGNLIGREYAAKSNAYGTNTDTIFYVQILNNDVTLVNIPRDIWLDEWVTKINSIYGYRGATELQQSVSNILGLPIDYYAIINLDIFEGLVDALGGVEVNVPYRMTHTDHAAQLFIDLYPGPQILDGEKAGHFIRHRGTARGDYDRVDHAKTLAFAMLKRVKELNIRAAAKLPELVSTVMNDVETNASPALIMELLPRLANIEIGSSLGVPTTEAYEQLPDGRVFVLKYDKQEVASHLASSFGGTAKTFSQSPNLNLLISNRSGVQNLGEQFKEQLIAMGLNESNLFVREESLDPTVTRLLATTSSWDEADYYTNLFQTSKQQIDHLPRVTGETMQLELILSEDAADSILAKQLTSSFQTATTQ